MQKALLIAEKGSLKRTIEAVYEKHKDEIPYEATFLEQRGNLITLKSPDELDETLKEWSWDTLPIHPEEHGGWKYKIIQEQKVKNYLTAKERYMKIKEALNSGKYDFIINAGDPDQEGELLIRIVLSSLGNKLPVKRYWSNETTEKKVLEALKNLRDDDNDPMLVNLLSAAYGRQRSDYRVGMNISRAASLKMGIVVACGRVKTPILGIVCKREKEIANFKPKTCYGVKAMYDKGFTGTLFDQYEEDIDNDKKGGSEEESAGIIWYDTKEEAENLISELSNTATVTTYKKDRVESYAPKLYKLATVQVAASKKGYTAQHTLDIIQGLYERGYMSYPRTDCELVSSTEDFAGMLTSAAVIPELRPFVEQIDENIFAKVKKTKKWVNDTELAKAGHSALTPTTKHPKWEELTQEEKDIYTLVCRQFVAIFLPPLVQDKTLLICDIDGYSFKSTGKTIVSEGYTTIFGKNSVDTVIPEYTEGEEIGVENFEVSEKTTVCPKRYTDGELINVCENPLKLLDDKSLRSLGKELKIGTPATRASIIEELVAKYKYLQRIQEKKTTYIVPTDKGMAIYENLKDCSICKIDMTGEWEIMLDSIRNGESTLPKMEQIIKVNVEDMIEDIKNMEMTPLKTNNESITVCECPSCGGQIKTGSKTYYCSNWKEKECKVGASLKICDSNLKAEEFAKMLSGQTIVKKISKGTNTWKQELKYNFETNRIEFIKNETQKTQSEESEYCCPNCGEKLMEKGKLLTCKNGDFKFWKVVCGKKLTDEQIDNFFNTGDTGLVGGLKSTTSGSIFSAHICLKLDKSGTEFIYERK